MYGDLGDVVVAQPLGLVETVVRLWLWPRGIPAYGEHVGPQAPKPPGAMAKQVEGAC